MYVDYIYLFEKKDYVFIAPKKKKKKIRKHSGSLNVENLDFAVDKWISSTTYKSSEIRLSRNSTCRGVSI